MQVLQYVQGGCKGFRIGMVRLKGGRRRPIEIVNGRLRNEATKQKIAYKQSLLLIYSD